MLVPWKYIKEQASLPKITPEELSEKLSYCGLETKIVKKENNIYCEFDILPNRADLLSWWGIIQEINVLLNYQIKPFNSSKIKESKEKLVEVEITTDNCQEFHLGLIKNIVVEESPTWAKEWLELNNIRSINNVVDIANLTMLETGQPLHIFDYDALLGEKKIIIQEARGGETMTTLHGQNLTLVLGDIVISSGGGFIDLAGIIGAQATALTSQTKNILIECASFNASSIKKTADRLNISTSASQFFSRGANLVLTPQCSLLRVISLIIESYGGNPNSGTIFTYKEAVKKKKQLPIAISEEFIAKKIGQTLSEQVIDNIWQRLGFFYQKEGNIYYVTVPP